MAPHSLAGQRALASQRATLQASVQLCLHPVAAASAAIAGTGLAQPAPAHRSEDGFSWLGQTVEEL